MAANDVKSADPREIFVMNATAGDIVLNVTRPGNIVTRGILVPAGKEAVPISKEDYEFIKKTDIFNRMVADNVLVVGTRVKEYRRAVSEPVKPEELAGSTDVGNKTRGNAVEAETRSYAREEVVVPVGK